MPHGENCLARYMANWPMGKTRTLAHMKGWRYQGWCDLCPKCAEKGDA